MKTRTGINAFLDGHAHNIIPGKIVRNENGEDVLLSSTGTKLEHIGLMKMSVSDDNTVTISTGPVDDITEEEMTGISYVEVEDSLINKGFLIRENGLLHTIHTKIRGCSDMTNRSVNRREN